MLKKMRPLIALLLLLLAACSSPSDTPDETTPPTEATSVATFHERMEIHMGTFVEIRLFHADGEALLDQAFYRIAYLERLLSVMEHTEASEVEEINRQAGLQPVQVSEVTFNLIYDSLAYMDHSAGEFNIAIGPLTRLWGISTDTPQRPDADAIADALLLVDGTTIQLDREAQTVFLPEVGMALDLGGVAKGFAADEVASLLRDQGVESAIINLGGDIYLIGSNPNAAYWQIGVRDPFSDIENPQLVGVVATNEAGFTSSGISDRYFYHDGVRYHHLLSPTTGFPFQNDIATVHVIAPTAFLSEIYTTVAFSLGITEGLAYLEQLDGIEALFISTDRGLYMTTGMQNLFTRHDETFDFR